MICRELIGNSRPSSMAQLNRYHWLHPAGKKLISSWLDRAWQKRKCRPTNSFEPFIFTWISFNGWAACVTELDRDKDMIDALKRCKPICDDFERLIADKKSPVSRYARQFHDSWPIFRAQEIRRLNVSRYDAGDRQEIVEHYLSSGIRSFEPQCWTRHREEGNPVPLDWPHTLNALYRVRCNLFHGEKSAHSEMDSSIVASAFRTLINFLHESKYIT